MAFIIVIVLLLFIFLFWNLAKPKKTLSRYQSIVQEKAVQQIKEPVMEAKVSENLLSPESVSHELSEPKEIPNVLANFHLIGAEETDPRKLKEILEQSESMARPHPIINALSTGVDSPEKLYQMLKTDPEIAAKILQTVNSPMFSLTQKITRLNHAIMYLGVNMVKDIAMQCAVQDKFTSSDNDFNLAIQKIWSYGFLASSLTFIMAKHLGFKQASELTTKALFAYIGDLAIISYQPSMADAFSKNQSLFERVKKEQKRWSTNSAIVGSELARRWDLPDEIVQGIQDNLIPMAIPPADCHWPAGRLADSVLCYLCCRCAELMINKKIKDIAQVNLLEEDLIELTYLPEYIKKAGLQDFFRLQQQSSFRIEANKFIPGIS